MENVDSENKSIEMCPNPGGSSDSQPVTMSKRQMKKLKKQALWEEKKKEKRNKERLKSKQKRLIAINKGLPARTGPSRKELKRSKLSTGPNSLKIAIDLDFDDLMSDKDIAKCVKQLLRMYTINRRSAIPAYLYFVGIKESGRIHETLKKNDGYENWDVQLIFQTFSECFEADKIIYLTSDSDEVLTCVDPNKLYIIGGLVDHNHHKNMCFLKANKLSLKTARLPLNEHVEMKTRSVLSTYHVFEILLRLAEKKSWTEAILETIPVRKGAKAKTCLETTTYITDMHQIQNIKQNELSPSTVTPSTL